MYRQTGFTLIELLIVIAIIGVLAATIIPRLQTARDAGLETKIITELVAVGKRAAIEESMTLTYDIVCGSGGEPQSARIAGMIADIESFASSTVQCNSSPDGYALSVPINDSVHWCVDNGGASREIGSALSGGVFTCPDS